MNPLMKVRYGVDFMPEGELAVALERAGVEVVVA